ncbi:sugar ABC transporter substrate-binding protein [Jeotgalibacillus terrae]|uniref:Maltodextrin-binding protein n=1 Tax=Jeotgalibacillus terrae TaxID=587735 RepID=A0ABW5ZKB4_9BACL|nr:extracellular solute-binding protein [Jeotgalibacillus terrae]MBM7578115.1 arabinogalactan oligomer/maltooligosaccharide transport system substrate-binding protein [Jeotgalibacillus terrae]
MNKLKLTAGSLTLILVLSACAPERSQDQGTAAADAESEGLLVWAPDIELSAIESQVEAFTEETGIPVEVVSMPQDDQTEAIVLDGPAGNGPDLFYQPGVGNLSIQGLVQPVEVDQEILDSYSSGSLEALSYDGELYGLPAVVESLALYYNKSLIPDAPETVEDLEAAMAELTDDANDQFGFLYPANDFYFSYPFMAGFGGYIFNEDSNGYVSDDVGLANEGSVKGASLIQSWFESGYIPTSITIDAANGLFMDGQAGAIINGPWARYDFEEALGEDLGTAPLPMLENGEHPETFLGTKGWMLSSYSDYPEEATDLAVHLTSEASLKETFSATGEIPANTAILNSPEFTEDPMLAGFATQLERARPFPNIAELSAVWQPMADALTFIIQGDDPAEALEEGVEKIEEEIEINYE